MSNYKVLLLAKHTNESHVIGVQAESEDDAMNKVDKMIDKQEEYNRFQTGWKIAEAYSDEN